MFNTSEYVQLAAHASGRGDHLAALGFLREALALEPKHAAALYFFATECAELGLVDRAASGLEEALVADGSMDVARFQLSLLYWQHGDATSAQRHLSHLRKAENEEVRAYAEAIVALMANDIERAKERLSHGLRIPSESGVLKRNMHNLFQHLSAQPPVPKPVVEAEPQTAGAPKTLSTALPGAYEQLRAAK